ncbi:hypothetical protein [Phenylobacterium sp.]|jgi:hypothetical protein|uniref:hypothetical protein n=1 Tax=Phenylobacterium sp. TaxID=1871053 RepID=UPI002F95AB2A
MTVLSRDELFQRAWDRPLTDVAAELGVTSTALKKTCDRHDIPTPGRGYWAQLRAGRTFPRPKLRPVKDKRLEQVNIFGARTYPPAVEAAQALTRETSRAAKARPQAAAPQPAAAARPEAPERAPPEPKVLAATRNALLKAKPDRQGFLSARGKGVVPTYVGEPSVAPALAFLAALVRSAEAQGCSWQANETGVALLVAGEPIAFRLEEKPRRTRHLPTEAELARKARENWRRSELWPTYDEAPSGDLSLVIDANDYSGLRRTFSDGKTARLVDKLPDILAAFVGHAALIQERRREREEQQRRAEAAEARRLREAAFAAREMRRGEFVDLVAGKLQERARLSTALAHLESQDTGDRPRLLEMMAWIRRKLAEIDALIGAPFLDISACAAKLEFDEARALAQAAESTWFYAPAVALQLWEIDEVKDEARSQGPYDWARAQGLATVEPATEPG